MFVGFTLPIALVRITRIDRTLGVPFGFMQKNLGKDGSMVIVFGEWSGLFERRSVAGMYSGVWSSGGSYGCERVSMMILALEAWHPHW